MFCWCIVGGLLVGVLLVCYVCVVCLFVLCVCCRVLLLVCDLASLFFVWLFGVGYIVP